MNAISRAQFLRGDWRGQNPDIRPPGAVPEPAFFDLCDGCGDCVSACKENILLLTGRRLPLLDFSLGGCTFCGECASACDTGALIGREPGGQPPWQLRALISGACLATRGTSCVRCIEECEHDAIVATPAPGGRTAMRVEQLACTGCGFCVAGCPVDAISMKYGDIQ